METSQPDNWNDGPGVAASSTLALVHYLEKSGFLDRPRVEQLLGIPLAQLEDPDRRYYDRYFSRVWIPDESYYQTLVRLYSTDIESRSLTLSKFDFQGKPHVFYDDHLQLLRRSDCFVARKIWPYAERLYSNFLSPDLAHGRHRA